VLAQLSRAPAVGTQAFDAYARGRMLLERAGPGDSDAAMAAFESTIKLDPSFAPAYAALAKTYHDAAIGGHTSWLAHMERARTEANKALALDPTLAEAHVVLAQAAFHVDWDWNGAARAYAKAIALNPSDDYARQCYSHFLAARGELTAARQELEDARRVNPLSETNDIELVPLLQYERRFAEAETLARSVLVRPFQVNTQLGRIYSATGRFDEAIAQFEQLRASRIGNHPYVDAEIASAHAGAGRTAEAEAILERMLERSRAEEVPPELFALVYARLGDADQAFHHLDAAVAARSTRILWTKVDPRWDPLRADPRFGALIRRLGL
jgi:tetratricopeptide (TPR) repeat protein